MTKAIVLTQKRNIDVHLETTKALRYINFAIARGHDLSCAFKCRLSKVPLFIVKDNTLRKNDRKSKLEQTIEKKLYHPPTGIILSKDKKINDCYRFNVLGEKNKNQKGKRKKFCRFS